MVIAQEVGAAIAATASEQAGAFSDGELTFSAVLAWVTSKVVEFAKGRGWLGQGDSGATVNRIVSWAAAFAVSLGLAWTYDSQTGDWILRGNVNVMVEGIGHFLRQLMLQEIAYKQFVRPDTERRALEASASTGSGT